MFFFFKQKTAYEMRISDWSSDVCSSDLLDLRGWMRGFIARGGRVALPIVVAKGQPLVFREWRPGIKMAHGVWKIPIPKSEEHTSELQSPMRISYAVFCLKKKTYTPTQAPKMNHYHTNNTRQDINQ